ncbi:MAG: hypothetical protein OEZ16_10400, partial [Chromatiales bacterium]|nr:hypothetical protein [Chromatiales bacterium]
MRRGFFYNLAVLWLVAVLAVPVMAEPLELELSSGAVITVERYGKGRERVLWIPSEYGLRGEVEGRLATAVAGADREVWLVDPHGSYFMPPGRSSFDRVPRGDIGELIARAHADSEQLFLLSYGRGAALMLEAARL